MNYGFVIDQRKCIGCHACTVACKEENRVPLGAFRTWVKYVERGTFPDTRRYFAVLRCNHCDDAPCVTICPTVALYRRPDGIVDFDNARCIGCKSCMQACPYDALYIDPETNTAAKCNYCAHRVEVGLEPACVIVCPEQAIVAGDLDDPRAPIARLVGREQVQVRKPEQGTRPKVFYLGVDASALSPPLQQPVRGYMWATRPAAELDLVDMVAALSSSGETALSRPVYDVPHAPRPWGWRVSAYLWTKAVSAGALLVAAAGVLSGQAFGGRLGDVVAPVLALVFLALTLALLVLDLKRPDRFYFMFLMPNWRSWLVRGAWVLLGYGILAAAWLAGALGGDFLLLRVLAMPAIVLASATAGYSALLFGQAEGRDFWQSPLLLVHLLVAAVVAGSAALLLAQVLIDGTDARPLAIGLGSALVLEAVVKLGELWGSHANVDVARAAALVTRGHFARRFWWGAMTLGLELPLALLLAAVVVQQPALSALAAVFALAGLWVWEDIWIRAGQAIPLS
jgi:Fe-S-cluster-containing dehydrogenase component/formate-dependent nitrite reductase membrane component NrfD